MAHDNDGKTSDLIDQVHHEHEHLRRLFSDLASSFAEISVSEIGEGRQKEVIAAAKEDLAVALDDMLHHFNQEEEVFFVEIETQFPELKPRIDGLVKGHELMSQRTRWLHGQLNREPQELARDLEVVVDVLESMASLITGHTEEETELFDDVLKSMEADQRKRLLKRMREI